MQTREAMVVLSELAELQGRLVRRFLELHNPKDRESFRDVPNGTLVLKGAPWSHRRHGFGVLFTSAVGVRVNAHVGMAEFPEGIDGGRVFEYLDSLGVATVTFYGREHPVTPSAIAAIVDDMARAGLLRPVITKESFPHRVFEVVRRVEPLNVGSDDEQPGEPTK